jgi:hypothetical protein
MNKDTIQTCFKLIRPSEKNTKEQPIMGNTIHKQAKDRATGTPLNRVVNACVPEG